MNYILAQSLVVYHKALPLTTFKVKTSDATPFSNTENTSSVPMSTAKESPVPVNTTEKSPAQLKHDAAEKDQTATEETETVQLRRAKRKSKRSFKMRAGSQKRKSSQKAIRWSSFIDWEETEEDYYSRKKLHYISEDGYKTFTLNKAAMHICNCIVSLFLPKNGVRPLHGRFGSFKN